MDEYHRPEGVSRLDEMELLANDVHATIYDLTDNNGESTVYTLLRLQQSLAFLIQLTSTELIERTR